MRHLRFQTLHDAALELDRIENARSVRTTGVWSLAQIFDHLGAAFEFAITSYPRLMPAAVRKTVGRLVFKRMTRAGYMKPGAPNPAAPKVREEGDADEALRRLRRSMAAFEAHTGGMAVHPFFDTLSRDEFAHLMAMHMANHLSFVEYEGGAERTAPAVRKAPAPKGSAAKKSVKKSVKKSAKKAKPAKTKR